MFQRMLFCLFAVVLGWMAMASSPAQAQLRVCGPGETPVAMDTRNPSVPVPLCPPSTTAPSSGGGEAPTYAAMAWHPDANDVWVDGNWNGPNNGAQGGALARCQQIMGEGCTIGATWNNSSYQLYRNGFGSIYAAWAYDKNELRRVEAECKGDFALPCEKLRKLSSAKDHYPGVKARKKYIVGAWVNAMDQFDNKLYIASGEPTYAAGEAKAMAACARANPGAPCAVATYSGDGVLQAYMQDTAPYITAETSAKRAKSAAQTLCKQAGAKKCAMQASYDAKRPGQFVHDYAMGKAK